MKILGIETSCDETALALFENEKLLYSKVSSHMVHKNYGGVVPELASREHDKILPQLFKDCFKKEYPYFFTKTLFLIILQSDSFG